MKRIILFAALLIASPAVAEVSVESVSMECFPDYGQSYRVDAQIPDVLVITSINGIKRRYEITNVVTEKNNWSIVASRPDQRRILIVRYGPDRQYLKAFGRNSDGSPGGTDQCELIP